MGLREESNSLQVTQQSQDFSFGGPGWSLFLQTLGPSCRAGCFSPVQTLTPAQSPLFGVLALFQLPVLLAQPLSSWHTGR